MDNCSVEIIIECGGHKLRATFKESVKGLAGGTSNMPSLAAMSIARAIDDKLHPSETALQKFNRHVHEPKA